MRIDRDALKRRSVRRVRWDGRVRWDVGCDHLSWRLIDDGALRAGEPRLVEADDAEQVEPAGTDVSDLEQEVCAHGVLYTRVVLVKVRRADIAVKDMVRQREVRHEGRELICRWDRKEGI